MSYEQVFFLYGVRENVRAKGDVIQAYHFLVALRLRCWPWLCQSVVEWIPHPALWIPWARAFPSLGMRSPLWLAGPPPGDFSAESNSSV
jgi:hypothetical protein